MYLFFMIVQSLHLSTIYTHIIKCLLMA